MAEHQAIRNAAPQQHGITHSSVGHDSYETIDKAQSGMQEKSGQWSLNTNETPMRSTTTFFVPPQQKRDRRWWHRIGRPGMIVLTVGTAAILFCVALLIFLWEGARRARGGRPRTEFWDTIVFDNWTTQLVTICSAGIRVSMGFQIGLAAAAMAAVILETAGSRFCDTAMLSIQRASSSSAGPLDLLPTAWRHCLAGRISGLLYFPILALMVAIALVSTLTSTILLFDLEQGHISAPIATHLKAVGFDNSSMYPYSSIAYWKSRPLAHWRFAETRPAEMETELRTENAVDTGDVYRAMLPFDSATDRTTLEYYQGSAVVINQRTACFAPTFSNATVQWESGEGIAISGLHLNATSIVENQTDFLGSEMSMPMPIHCRIHNDWNSTSSDNLPISLCSRLEAYDVPVRNGSKNPLSGWSYGFRYIPLISSGEVLNGLVSRYIDGIVPPEVQKELNELKFRQNGPWTTAYASDGTEVFNATICYVSQNLPHRHNVTMTGRAIASEPNFLTEVSSLTVRRNDTGVLRQLGVGISPNNTTGRGILDLQVHPGPDLWIDPDEEDRLQSAYLLLWVTLVEYSVIGGWSLAGGLMKNDITTMVTWSTHPEHAAVFQKDPSADWRSSTSGTSTYLSHLPDVVTTINTQEVLIPQKWTGFAVVMAIIAAHFAVTALTIVLFAKRTESSLLGNAWQAVSQMVSPETQDIIRAAGGEGMKDKEVEVLAKSAGRSREAYALSSGIHSGRTELRVRQI
ncbi:hypothetical protein CEP52_004462 [Fusarium oligoseptatum]|uniref:Uncharacterized protein n=1 Tax=Fusarium oligoseptatum TaxID=2604345 RepID=A0A428U3C6_9HYPO|nr:hypothetical protein CEP52_004462 [Fusarium oligoseptatum]